jgi:hypothetical protein
MKEIRAVLKTPLDGITVRIDDDSFSNIMADINGPGEFFLSLVIFC